ncbi:MAG: hypothetical protein WDW38_011589 [Sanguina aurantia]
MPGCHTQTRQIQSAAAASNGGSSTLDPLPAVGSGHSSMPPQRQQHAAPKRQPPLTLALDSAVHIAPGPKQQQQQQQQQQGVRPQQVPSPGGTPPPRPRPSLDVQALWRALRDSLALTLLAGVFLAAGLPSPFGLLALPAQSLAVAMCSCRQLRHMGSTDSLWQGLMADFGPAATSASDSSQSAQHRGWAHVYARKAREQQARAAARARQSLCPCHGRSQTAPPGSLASPLA